MNDMRKDELVRLVQSLQNENARLRFHLRRRVSLPVRVWRFFFGWPVQYRVDGLNVGGR